MHTLWHWLLHLLTWASADPGLIDAERARAAGSVIVAYAALAPEPAPRKEMRNERELGSELGKTPPPAAPTPTRTLQPAAPTPTPPLPPAAPCVQCSGTGRIYRSDGGWVRCPCQCPAGKCPPKR